MDRQGLGGGGIGQPADPEQDGRLGLAAGVLDHEPDGAFSHLGYEKGAFPNAERAAQEILSLPIYPGITEAQQSRVAEALREAVG